MKASPELRQWFADRQVETEAKAAAWLAEHAAPVPGHHPDCDGWMTGPHAISVEATDWGGWRMACACGWAAAGSTGRMPQHEAEQLARAQHTREVGGDFSGVRCDLRCQAWG